jgi:hypothetical protein
MYPNGPVNNGQMPITLTPPDQLGGTSSKSVTVLPNLVSVNPSPPAADFVPSPGRGAPAAPSQTAGY